MKNKLSLFILVVLFLFNSWVSAADNISKISWITYDWNLSKMSVINIKWENLDKCNTLNVNWKNIEISKKDKSIISFMTWENFKYDWIIKLECLTVKLEKQYSFPYIESISWLNNNINNKQITIIWHNFTNLPIVTLKWWTFAKNFSEDRMIIWNLPAKLENNELYITSNWLKSNVFYLDLKIPKINYVFSASWFKDNWNILIYWDNLNEYNNTKAYFWSQFISNFTYNRNESYISFPADLISWKSPLKLVSNWFESNQIEIKISNWKPIIEGSVVKNSLTDANWKITQKNYLVLLTKNLPINLKNITIYNNKVVIPKYTIIWNEIFIELDKFWYWNNLLQIELYWEKSNVINYKNESKLPNLVSLEMWATEKNNRSVELFIQDFNIKEDKVFLNWAEKKLQSCFSNICKLQIPDSTLKWIFAVWKWNVKNTKVLYFDITSEKFNSKKVIISNKDAESPISIEKLKIDKSDFDLNIISTGSLYTLSLDNKIEDVVLKNISFKVENYKNENYLSTFKLKIWNIESEPSLISSNWIINFNWRFDLPKSNTKYSISLIKDSNYINIQDFNVNFIKDDFELEKISDWSKYSNIVFWTYSNNTIKIVNNDKYINCKDSKNDNTNCNKVLKITPVKIETKTTDTKKVDVKK